MSIAKEGLPRFLCFHMTLLDFKTLNWITCLSFWVIYEMKRLNCVMTFTTQAIINCIIGICSTAGRGNICSQLGFSYGIDRIRFHFLLVSKINLNNLLHKNVTINQRIPVWTVMWHASGKLCMCDVFFQVYSPVFGIMDQDYECRLLRQINIQNENASPIVSEWNIPSYCLRAKNS